MLSCPALPSSAHRRSVEYGEDFSEQRMKGGKQSHVIGTCQPLPHKADPAPRPNKVSRASYEVLFASSCYLLSSPGFSQSVLPARPLCHPEEARPEPGLQLLARLLLTEPSVMHHRKREEEIRATGAPEPRSSRACAFFT
jgi:hypothetical protein